MVWPRRKLVDVMRVDSSSAFSVTAVEARGLQDEESDHRDESMGEVSTRTMYAATPTRRPMMALFFLFPLKSRPPAAAVMFSSLGS